MEINAYRVMWVFVFFDLPTDTKRDRKNANNFRKKLLKDGFEMMQFSVYIRHCASSESADVHEKRVSSFLPPKGKVNILRVTDKQYSKIKNFIGLKKEKLESAPIQLELF